MFLIHYEVFRLKLGNYGLQGWPYFFLGVSHILNYR